jgi:hypothetical protein
LENDLFRKEALDSAGRDATLSRPVADRLVWLVLTALLALLAGAAVFALTANIPRIEKARCFSLGNGVWAAFLPVEARDEIREGTPCEMAGINGGRVRGVVRSVNPQPLGRKEAVASLPDSPEAPRDFIAWSLDLPEWSVRVEFAFPVQSGLSDRTEVSIITGMTRPLDYVF